MPLEIHFKSSIYLFILLLLHLMSGYLFYQTFSGSLKALFLFANTISCLIAIYQYRLNHAIKRLRILPDHSIYLKWQEKEEKVSLHSAFISRYLLVATWQGEQQYRQYIFPWMVTGNTFRQLRVWMGHSAVMTP